MPTKEEIQTFSSTIEDVSMKYDLSLLDSICFHCEQTGLEIEVAATLISPILKSKLKEEAQDNNLLKKQSRLPI